MFFCIGRDDVKRFSNRDDRDLGSGILCQRKTAIDSDLRQG
jgi:hypothetical protein